MISLEEQFVEGVYTPEFFASNGVEDEDEHEPAPPPASKKQRKRKG